MAKASKAGKATSAPGDRSEQRGGAGKQRESGCGAHAAPHASLTDEPPTIQGLAAHLNVNKPATTRALDRLEELELVPRAIDGRDRRSVLVRPTAGGAAMVKRLGVAMVSAAASTARVSSRPPRAKALYASILPALRALEASVAAETLFDAASDGRIFRLGASELTAIIVLPGLLAKLRQEAPRCRIVQREGDHLRIPAMLANGDISAVAGYLGDGLPDTTGQRVLERMN
ncbi:MarR family transcriptional regulator [Belnapia sp. T18]|uniref:MarR family transcriptional regulator n=1 Tax=Belnapia arida TaxID=2804533 RepID=A0ABS1U941_9PROT|nr:MarR family transcriptional regulator [Belnapia arida]MBL6080454.1 MarR family transcriptional regulator [Belnapia arida]